MCKPNTVWGYYWPEEIQKNARMEKKLLRAAAAIPGGPSGCECNLKCIFCFTKCGTRFSNDRTINNQMVLDFLKDATQYVYNKELMNYFLVSEGEPTLNPDLIPMLKEISSLGGTMTIFSNLLALSDEIVDAFAEIKNLFVCGKMYGFTPETNDYLTGVKGSYEQMMLNIEKLKDRGLASENRLGIQCVLTSYNIGEAFEIFRWARENNIVPHMMMFRKQGYGEDHAELELPIEKLQEYFKQCSDYDKAVLGYEWNPRLPLLVNGDCCIPGINIYLTNNGDLKMCACSDIPLGNYFEEDLKTVLFSEEFQEVRDKGKCLMYVEE